MSTNCESWDSWEPTWQPIHGTLLDVQIEYFI
jgi:hypothetical protein